MTIHNKVAFQQKINTIFVQKLDWGLLFQIFIFPKKIILNLFVLKIGYDKERDYHKFYVEDTGIGIQPEYHEQIFKIFTRLKDIETEGTGVGLVIASKIVNLHNGKIWVESPVKEARGARFCFTIPI